jgi:hypothetical protein
MFKNSLIIMIVFMILLLLSGSVLAQSHSPGLIDNRNEKDQSTNPNSRSNVEMQNNPAGVRPNSPAMVNPSDPTGVNSNIPGSGGTPPSSNAPGTNPGGQSNVNSPSGY